MTSPGYKNLHKSEKFWDRIARLDEKQVEKPEQANDTTLYSTSQYLGPDYVVLDYGCGPGKMTCELAPFAKTIHAVDISSGMIAAAEVKAASQKIDNIKFHHANVFDLPFEPASFDAVFASNILHLLDSPKMELQKFQELLKPGGMFISTTACLGQKKTLTGVCLGLAGKVRLVPKMHFYQVPQLESLIFEQGFEKVESKIIGDRLNECFIVARKPD